MANENVVLTCDGASGRAGAFVVTIEANGQSVDQVNVTGQPVPERDGAKWNWSMSWHIEGDATVELVDWTHIDWTTGRGTVRNVHATYELSCPVETTTTAPTSTSELATTTTQLVTTTATATTTTVASEVSSTEPTVTVGLEPSTTVAPTTEAPTTTLVILNTAPAPQRTEVATTVEPTTTTDYSGLDLYVSDTTPELTTTTLAEPVGCCSDVGDTTATTLVVRDPLPATGGDVAPLVGLGLGALAVGVLLAVVASRRPRHA